jgi:hypothetical protein
MKSGNELYEIQRQITDLFCQFHALSVTLTKLQLILNDHTDALNQLREICTDLCE